MDNQRKTKIKCPTCDTTLRRILVSVQGAKNKAVSHQCPKCGYYEYEAESSKKVLLELKEHPLKIRHKIVKLSKDRLGIYFNSNIIRSLALTKGEEVLVSVPDKKHIVLEIP